MTDTDKVKLINHVVADVREFGDCGDAAYLNGCLDVIGSICDYEENDNEQENQKQIQGCPAF